MNIEYVLCVIQINVDVYVMKKSTNEVRGDNKKPFPLFGCSNTIKINGK